MVGCFGEYVCDMLSGFHGKASVYSRRIGPMAKHVWQAVWLREHTTFWAWRPKKFNLWPCWQKLSQYKICSSPVWGGGKQDPELLCFSICHDLLHALRSISNLWPVLLPVSFVEAMSTGKRLVADSLMSIGERFGLVGEGFFSWSWSWKTAPHPGWMSKIHGLVLYLVQLAPKLVLQSSKVKSAAQKLCSWKRINKSRYVDRDFADPKNQRLRSY